MQASLPPLLRRIGTDEYVPLPHTVTDATALARYADIASHSVDDRRSTAATLLAMNDAHGEMFYSVPSEATSDLEAAKEAFRGVQPVIDVQTHLVDPARWRGTPAAALSGFLQMVHPERWEGGVDPNLIDAAAWASLVFGTSETAIALLSSTPGPATDNVLTNLQIAAARDVVERYAGTRKVLTHAIVHPNLGRSEIDGMSELTSELHPNGWKCYTLYGPPTARSPAGGWFLDDEEVGFPFLEQVRAHGPRVIATHKGLSGSTPDAAHPAASPRDIGPAAAAFPDITFVVYHSGYERNAQGEEGPYDASNDRPGVDGLIRSLADAGIGPDGNVYAELGSTWFLMLRRPFEAAHVLGKLLAALGPDRIIWGTDSTWYGSPQPLIDAFRAFRIPDSMQERYGYPPLDAYAKERILSYNARAVYDLTDGTVEAAAAVTPEWVTNGVVELRRALARFHERS